MHINNKPFNSSSTTTTKTISRIVILIIIVLFFFSLFNYYPFPSSDGGNQNHHHRYENILRSTLLSDNRNSEVCDSHEEDQSDDAFVWSDGSFDGKIQPLLRDRLSRPETAKYMNTQTRKRQTQHWKQLLSLSSPTSVLKWEPVSPSLRPPSPDRFGLFERKSEGVGSVRYGNFLRSEGVMACSMCGKYVSYYWLEKKVGGENITSRNQLFSFLFGASPSTKQQNNGLEKAIFFLSSTVWISNKTGTILTAEVGGDDESGDNKHPSGYLFYIPPSRYCVQWCKGGPYDRAVLFLDRNTGEVSLVGSSGKNVMTALCID